jgi:undecaprenyl diphosphate synthase
MAEQGEQPNGSDMKIPQHIAIIMDGNGRWAEEHGVPRNMGHRAGAEAIRGVVEACAELGIKVLTLYAFSTENWTRPPDEVRHLMGLVDYLIQRELDHLHRNGVKIRHIGRNDGVDEGRLKKIHQAVEKTRHNERLILNIAFNYGGRAEIVDAVKAIVREGVPADEITEETIARHLHTYPCPDPDLIIRTGGEFRLSNFLIWQASYSEFFSTDLYWPDFGRATLLEAVRAFGERDRRYGGRPAVKV